MFRDVKKQDDPDQGRTTSPCCRRVPAADRRRALAMLLTGRPREEDAAVDQFLSFADQQKLAVDDLWQIDTGGKVEAAALLVPCAGRCGMLFLSPITSPYQARRLTLLVKTMDQALATAGKTQAGGELDILQCLLEPRQRLHEQALRDAGWRRLAVLNYMRKQGLPALKPLRLSDASIQVTAWDEAHQPLFERAIEASYQQTLDCPGLLGLRRTQDILAGHMAAGLFCPGMWHVLHRGDEPVGVVLVNQVVGRQAAELVYLGLSPAWRGRGLALPLMEHAMGQAQAAGAQAMLLAVDQANVPALRLYKRLGFGITGNKVAMIRTVRTLDDAADAHKSH